MKRHHLRGNPTASQRWNKIHRPVKENLAVKHQFRDDPSSKSSPEEEEQKHVELREQNRQLNRKKVEEENQLACTREDLKKMVKGLMRRQCIRTGNKDCDNITEC